MPEGPSIVILREELSAFEGKKVKHVEGNTRIDLHRLSGASVLAFKSWGKHFLICFPGFFIRIHLLMFGTYRIDERKDAVPRLSMRFSNGEVNFYSCGLKLIDGNPEEFYDWSTDLMSPKWNSAKARRVLADQKDELICDLLLDQTVFSGAGNIIKNEVLFRVRTNPNVKVGSLSTKRRNAIVKDMRAYSLQFYRWKKKFQLRKHWLIYKKLICPRCGGRVTRSYLGKTNRLTCYCANCQR